jgi:hypothetical protein
VLKQFGMIRRQLTLKKCLDPIIQANNLVHRCRLSPKRYKVYKVTPEMSNRDTHLTKQQKSPQFVTPFCQIIGIQSQSEVTAFCQIMTSDWQVMSLICQMQLGHRITTDQFFESMVSSCFLLI